MHEHLCLQRLGVALNATLYQLRMLRCTRARFVADGLWLQGTTLSASAYSSHDSESCAMTSTGSSKTRSPACSQLSKAPGHCSDGLHCAFA